MARVGGILLATTAAWVAGLTTRFDAQSPAAAPTFTKDVAPILQKSCVSCHRAGQMAPMSLRTYEEVRPWARSIRDRVSRREMPPFHLDRNVGITEYVDDPSLTEAEIATIVNWANGGAPRGNPADMPAQRVFTADHDWQLGKPDLIVTMEKDYVVPAVSEDQQVDFVVPTGLTEDRYIKAIEAKPTQVGRKVLHHMLAYAIQEPQEGFDPLVDSPGNDTAYLVEYVPGTLPDVLPEGTGRLLRAGSKIKFSSHYHSIGEEIRDRISIAFVLYPKGYTPKHQVQTVRVRPQPGADGNYLDIPPGARNVRHDGYFRLERPAKIISFQPHMHYRGQAMSLEAILPSGHTQMLTSVSKYDWPWQLSYTYKYPPAFPAGTLLHTITYYDNSAANKYNPDPTAWVGFGQRTIDEMANGWTDFIYISDEEYREAVGQTMTQQH
jgi:hypothetical protein